MEIDLNSRMRAQVYIFYICCRSWAQEYSFNGQEDKLDSIPDSNLEFSEVFHF